jgi:hypothetical protein
MLTKLFATVALLLSLASAQDPRMLRVRVVLVDASGVATPIPRLVLLVSDDPPTAEPRRVRTGADGTVELKLAPGSYTVELDEPIAFRGKAYTWTQIVEVAAGRDTVLDLTLDNAEAAAGARISADSATLLTAWRDSVVEIWTPTRHASGFVIDAGKGLIATSHHALGEATAVEVQLTAGAERLKVPGRVIVSEREPGAAVVWIDPQTLRATRAIDAGCAGGSFPAAAYKDTISTITASMFGAKEVSDGAVSRVTAQAIFSDLRIGSDSAGGPVFAESGVLAGISAIDDKGDRRRWNEAWVIPVERACGVIAAAVKKTEGATPPPATRLPLDPIVAPVKPVTGTTASAPAKPKPQTLPAIAASSFDITVLTPQRARDIEPGMAGIRGDFGTWTEYVRDAEDVWLVRVSPQFEESMWKMIARAAASTQGISLPPLKSFTSNFLQMRAYCGDSEVAPIHPFIIEHAIADRAPIREGLYVFELGAFGPQCSTIRFSMFSEKDPTEPDTKAIDPKLFEQLMKP